MNIHAMPGARILRRAFPGLILGLFLVSGIAVAQSETSDSRAANVQAVIAQVEQAQTRIQSLNRQLQQIQQQAFAENPELATQRDALQDLLDERMREDGFDAEASRARMESIVQDMENAELSERERMELGRQFRQEQTQMQQAQSQVMRDEDVQQRIEGMNEALISAMRESDAETDALIEQLDSAQQEYQSLMQNAMQNHGGNSPH